MSYSENYDVNSQNVNFTAFSQSVFSSIMKKLAFCFSYKAAKGTFVPYPIVLMQRLLLTAASLQLMEENHSLVFFTGASASPINRKRNESHLLRNHMLVKLLLLNLLG